ncbi:Fpg/Nei family DNA glycosylase [Aquihabitans sp. McL0605]|uniref:Fpg/Nei family DNA glycosylase n=1 Tax=Aquihabitans sp. McL0605 TaxID=3415671 RepID=UPI003CFAEBB3
MPEGHTIHRLARDQRADLAGRALHVSSAQARSEATAAVLDGHVLRRTEAWGKHLFLTFDSREVLHVHLGLIGKWFRRLPDEVDGALPAPTATTRLRLEPADPSAGDETLAWDLIGPMLARAISPAEKRVVTAKLGPDPLRKDADPDRTWARLQRSDKPVGLLLMEQDVVAGIGNVYRSELLNIVGVDPRRAGRAVERDEFDRLWAETVRQLRLGVRRNRIVTMDADELPRPLSKLRRGEGRFVYKQDRCGRCGTELDIYPLAGRTTWSCPHCQPR